MKKVPERSGTDYYGGFERKQMKEDGMRPDLPEESEQQLATAAVLQVCSMMNTLSAEEGLTPPTDAVPKKKGRNVWRNGSRRIRT